ncbi:thiopeptide-type bacteriocin biosynthesis protein [Micromonospora sp. LOL_024]|uniref:thiopeptide-type bacteriocin biosynthesis protein n=1 Tax=Micromonospora sp. LOL_024 TaxID=3345412 RepID=UPI003A8C2296
MTVATAPTPTAPSVFSSLHCYLHWKTAHLDTFITDTLTPLMEGLRGEGRIDDWFFIRYAEHGPHLRVRARGGDAREHRRWQEHLAAAARAAEHSPLDLTATSGPDWPPHAHARQVPYQPEIERYGGPAAIGVAEKVFGTSSRIAAEVIARTPRPGERMVAATDLVLATTVALDLDMLAAARWLRRSATSWRWHLDTTTLTSTGVQGPALAAATTQARSVVRRWHQIAAPAPVGGLIRDRWAAQVRAARVELEAGTGGGDRWAGVWSSQLHMLLNRLGILPDEERSLYFFLAAALVAPDGPTDFFADDTTSADRRYLVASSYAPGRIEWQQPRATGLPGPGRPRPAAGPLTLPAAVPVATSLVDALESRASGRGDLGGVVDAAQLGTLLWTAAGATARPAGGTRRPYPSAGAKYAVRLRLVARDVAGVPSYQYDVDPESRVLLPVGPVPTDGELAAASMWFEPDPTPRPSTVDIPAGQERIVVSTLPALLGIYLDLTVLRAGYGLRALRFGLLEAGHLAQNLALTAAAAGMALGVVGGFYDDIAHELLLLDGVDEVLTCLLPVGRSEA